MRIIKKDFILCKKQKTLTMKKLILILCIFTSFSAESQDDIVNKIIDEATNNSQLEVLAHELLDVIGPRLTGTPQKKQAADWAINKYNSWGVNAELHEFGEWTGWERGITHVDMVSPRIRTLSGRQLAYSPSTSKEGITGEIVFIPEVENKEDFTSWLETIKGKFVLSSMYQSSGRPDYNWEEFATEESLQKIREERRDASRKWYANFSKMGVNRRSINSVLEDAGAIGLLSSNWAGGFGANRVFSAGTKNIPNIDLDLEDYTMLYRMVKSGVNPKIKVVSTSKDLGVVPTFNTLAMIKGTEKPEEYVILSAHFDSWDGATGATDNGTGTIVMMEAMRILKAVYPNPKRTILVGLWGFEEGGLNGSRAFVEDFPDIVKNTQALFNQDNGTGRVINIGGQGFLNSYEYVSRWLYPVPNEIKKHIETNFPGMPGGGGSDYASFVALGVPAFSLRSLDWAYGNYTWHTNKDTYDKIVFDDVRSNVILTAILTYMASEDNEKASREKRVMPINPRTGKEASWPRKRNPRRKPIDN
jgi:carboxypeptidase Q|tara:strand:+ start:62 stop:1654 length:1593 start_codon:yes stop_codon:yes gene_type:complete